MNRTMLDHDETVYQNIQRMLENLEKKLHYCVGGIIYVLVTVVAVSVFIATMVLYFQPTKYEPGSSMQVTVLVQSGNATIVPPTKGGNWYPSITASDLVHLHLPQAYLATQDVKVWLTTVSRSQLVPRNHTVINDTFNGNPSTSFQVLLHLQSMSYMLKHSTINLTIVATQSATDVLDSMYLVVYMTFSSLIDFKLGKNPSPYCNHSIVSNGSTPISFTATEDGFYFFGVYKPEGVQFTVSYDAMRYYYNATDYAFQPDHSLAMGGRITLPVSRPDDSVLAYVEYDNDNEAFYNMSVTPQVKKQKSHGYIIGIAISAAVILICIGILCLVLCCVLYVCIRRTGTNDERQGLLDIQAPH